jgi:hypothetical protein
LRGKRKLRVGVARGDQNKYFWPVLQCFLEVALRAAGEKGVDRATREGITDREGKIEGDEHGISAGSVEKE